MEWLLSFLLDLQGALLSVTIATIGAISLKFFEKKKKRKWKHPHLMVVGLFLLLYIVTTIAYHFFMRPDSTEQIKKYREQILYLRVDYETIDHSDPTYSDITEADRGLLTKVRKLSPKLLEKLKVIPDENLTFGYKILKYDLMAYIGTIAAEVETNIPIKRKLIGASKDACDETFYLVKQTRKRAEAGDPEYSKIWNWIVDDEMQNRLHSIMAWLFAIEARLDEQITNQERHRVMEELGKIDYIYRQRYPLRNNPSLRQFINIP